MNQKTGPKEIGILVLGLALFGLAMFYVIRGGAGNEESAPSTPTTVDEVTATEVDEATETSTEPSVAEPTTTGDEPVEPVTGDEPAPTTPADQEPVEPTTEDEAGLTPDDSLIEVPDDPEDPRAIAAAYVTDSRTMDYRVGPNVWIEDADYLSDELAETLGAGTDLIDAQWEDDYAERQFIQEVENIRVKLEDSGDPALAMVFVQWNTYTMQRDSIDTRGSDQAILVIMEDIDGRWQVTGEGYPH